MFSHVLYTEGVPLQLLDEHRYMIAERACHPLLAETLSD